MGKLGKVTPKEEKLKNRRRYNGNT